MKYTAPLLAALSGLALISAIPSPAMAAGPEDKASESAKNKQSLQDLLPELKKPELWIGSSAPELSIAKFIKGDSVDQFEDGQVYVVEFWATWCGPCIAAFPHLSEMQADFGEDVRFIGVNVFERVEGAERMELVEKFVENQGERMSYTVAIEDGKSMAENWMYAAGRNSIPSAFIVDGSGKVAWMGHPNEMEKELKSVVSGDYDIDSAAERIWREQTTENVPQMAFQTAAKSFKSGQDLERARKIADILIEDHFEDYPAGLNAVAWMLLSSEAEGVGMQDYQTGLRAAGMACNQTEWKDWGVLDTYALGMFKTGDKVAAIKWEKKAIELAKADDQVPANVVAELEAQLASFED